MEQANERMREITEFLRNLNFKKKGSGVDKEDVLDKIEQLTIMYHMILEEQSDIIEALQTQNRNLCEQVEAASAPAAEENGQNMELAEQVNRLHAALADAQRAKLQAEEKSAELRNAMEHQQARLLQLQNERAQTSVIAPVAPAVSISASYEKEEISRQEFYMQALRREIAVLEERRADMEHNLLTEVRALEAVRKLREENQSAAQTERKQLREGLRGLREECVRVLSAVSEFDKDNDASAEAEDIKA